MQTTETVSTDLISDQDWFKNPGVRIPEGWDYGTWEAAGHRLRRATSNLAWKIGEWLNYGEMKFGETYVQAADALGYDQGYLRRIGWIWRKCEAVSPRYKLPLSYYEPLATDDLSDDERLMLLERADTLTRNGFRSLVKVYIEQRSRPDVEPEEVLSAKHSADRTPMTAQEAGGKLAEIARQVREAREQEEAEALQSRRQPEPDTVEEPQGDEPFAQLIADAVAATKPIVERERAAEGYDLHAECVPQAKYDLLTFEIRDANERAGWLRRQLDEANANIRNLQSQLDAYVDSCARLTPAAKEDLQWLRERRAPVGGVLPDEDETLEWALERVVAKVKSDMGRKR